MRGGRISLAAAILSGSVVFVAACGSTHKSAEKAAAAEPTPAQRMFEQVKSLAGTWEGKDPEGKPQQIVFRVVSGGSAVCEQMFPGQPHEMVNMYHLDGDRLLVTHYCAMGNQPRMSASTQPSATEIVFHSESVTNLAHGSGYMGGLVLDMPDAHHLVERWSTVENGKSETHAEFALTRR